MAWFGKVIYLSKIEWGIIYDFIFYTMLRFFFNYVLFVFFFLCYNVIC